MLQRTFAHKMFLRIFLHTRLKSSSNGETLEDALEHKVDCHIQLFAIYKHTSAYSALIRASTYRTPTQTLRWYT